MTYEGLLIHNCYIGSSTSSINEFGEVRPETWTYSTTSTKCRFVPLTLEEQSKIGGEFNKISYKVFFLSSASIDMGGRISYSGDYYYVRSKYFDSSHHHITCIVEQI